MLSNDMLYVAVAAIGTLYAGVEYIVNLLLDPADLPSAPPYLALVGPYHYL